jgi:hypothetical protein
MGINGNMVGCTHCWFLGMSLSYLYYMTGRWRTKTVIRHPEPAGEFAIPAEDPNGPVPQGKLVHSGIKGIFIFDGIPPGNASPAAIHAYFNF